MADKSKCKVMFKVHSVPKALSSAGPQVRNYIHKHCCVNNRMAD